MNKKMILLLFVVTGIMIGFLFEEVHASQSDTYTWESLKLNGGGYITTITIDPNSPNIVYAGCDVGGMYKSTDYGDNWTIINKGLVNDTDLAIAAIAVDPHDSNIVYIGTGKCWGNCQAGNPLWGGLFKSTDGGNSWQLLTKKVKFSGFGTFYATGNLIAINSSDTNIIYAGSHRDGLFKSTDAGNTWTYKGLVNENITSVIIDPSNSKVYVSAMKTVDGTQGGIFVSSDGGNTWITLNRTLNARYLVIDPTDPQKIYVAVNDSGVYKSVDGGSTWSPKNTGLNLNYEYHKLGIDPVNPSKIYILATERIYNSSDGGDTWTEMSGTAHYDYWEFGWPPMHLNDLVIDPLSPNRIYFGDWHSVWRTDDRGSNWYVKPWGLENQVIKTVVVDPKSPDIIYVGGMDIGLFKSSDGGKTFKRILGWNVWSVATDDSTDPTTIYAGVSGWEYGWAYPGRIFKSSDGGNTWTEINESNGLADPLASVGSVVVNQTNPQILYAGILGSGIYRSNNGGDTWGPKNNGLPIVQKPYKIILDEITQTLYVIVDNEVYKSVNGGDNWLRILQGTDRIRDIIVNPNNPQNLYVCGEDGVGNSSDGGNTWTSINPFSSSYDCGAISIDEDSTLYVGSWPWFWKDTLNGVYKSTDEGTSWTRIDNEDLMNLHIDVIETDPFDKNRLYLGTSGNGVFRGTSSTKLPWLHTDGKWIKNEQGNVVFLHGANFMGLEFGAWDAHTEEDYQRMASWGFNVVRLPIAWHHVEPIEGFYNETYFTEYVDRDITWAEKYGMYMILDMHQWFWSPHFPAEYGSRGIGIPTWMVSEYLNSEEGMGQAITDFWLGKGPNGTVASSSNPSMQDRMIAMWKYVTTRYKNEPTVAGYDLFNEPLPSSDFISGGLTPEQTANYLYPFYERLIDNITSVDRNHVIIYEPLGDYTSHGKSLETSQLLNKANITFSYHYYTASYSGNIDELRNSFSSAWDNLPPSNPIKNWNIPILVGEVGMDVRIENSSLWARDTMTVFDEYKLHWTWWCYWNDSSMGLLNPDRTEKREYLDYLNSPYPRSSSIEPVSFSYNHSTNKFNFTADCTGAQTTKVYAPNKPKKVTQDGNPIPYVEDLSSTPSWNYSSANNLVTVKFSCE